MSLITTYVCDCCGGQSTDPTKFQSVPLQTNIDTWLIRVDNALLCNICAGSIITVATNEAHALKGTKTGVQL